MIPENIEAVIFDFDGIIVDTEQVGVNVSTDLMKRRFKVDLTEADKHSFYGLQDVRFYQALLEKYGLTADVDNLMREHNAQYDTAIFQIRQPLPGVRELLSKIQERELPTAICSGSYEHQIRTILANLELTQYFRAVTSCEETQQHKPHPEPY